MTKNILTFSIIRFFLNRVATVASNAAPTSTPAQSPMASSPIDSQPSQIDKAETDTTTTTTTNEDDDKLDSNSDSEENTNDDDSKNNATMIRVYCKERPPVGIPVIEHLELNVAPLSIKLTNSFYKMMMKFFFDVPVQSNDDSTNSMSEQLLIKEATNSSNGPKLIPSLSLASANSTLRRSTNANTQLQRKINRTAQHH